MNAIINDNRIYKWSYPCPCGCGGRRDDRGTIEQYIFKIQAAIGTKYSGIRKSVSRIPEYSNGWYGWNLN